MKKFLLAILFTIFVSFGAVGLKNNTLFAKEKKISSKNGDFTSQLVEIIKISYGNLLSYYDDKSKEEFLSDAYSKKRKMFGSKIDLINPSIKVEAIVEIITEYYNGNINESIEYTLERTESSKLQNVFTINAGKKDSISATPLKGFTGKLNKELGINVKNTTEISKAKNEKTKMKIEPGQKLIRYIKGIGLAQNGIYQNYFLWMRTQGGFFEYCNFHKFHEVVIVERVRK